ncbi:MAG: TetR/AcrR family transcriptional regulator [Spirochaetales bacterium]|nr:TetR/AcrR family transcriptional regulator [Spirochaetales bacterium]
MARMKDETKRLSILESSKMLFSQKGFFNTSISDIVRETGFPVGTIYTYFKSKDEIVRTIVEEGWQQWYEQVEQACASEGSPEAKIRILIDRFIPRLFDDLDFISILLTEAIDYTRIEAKVEKLTDLTFSLVKPMLARSQMLQDLSRDSMQAALIIFFLGILDAARLARSSSIGLKESHITGFMKMIIENTFGVSL